MSRDESAANLLVLIGLVRFNGDYNAYKEPEDQLNQGSDGKE